MTEKADAVALPPQSAGRRHPAALAGWIAQVQIEWDWRGLFGDADRALLLLDRDQVEALAHLAIDSTALRRVTGGSPDPWAAAVREWAG